MTDTQVSSLLLGAVVSDAACLGLHWLYDPERIAEIAAAQGGHVAFTPVDPQHFEGVAGYFAHWRYHGLRARYCDPHRNSAGMDIAPSRRSSGLARLPGTCTAIDLGTHANDAMSLALETPLGTGDVVANPERRYAWHFPRGSN